MPGYGYGGTTPGGSIGDSSPASGGLSSGNGSNNGFFPGLNPEMGPGAQAPRQSIQNAQPSTADRIFSAIFGGIMPGITTSMRPDYGAGQPRMDVSFNPIGAMASFLGPLGFNPKGDMLSPGFADIPIGSTLKSDKYTQSGGVGGDASEAPVAGSPTMPMGAPAATTDQLAQVMLALQARQQSMGLVNSLVGLR